MHRLHPYPDVQVMFRRLLIATLIGLLAALAVALFRHAMVVLETLLLSNDSGSLVNAAQSLPAWRRLVTPALGGLAMGMLFACFSRLWLPGSEEMAIMMGLTGMAAFLAATTHAPIMSTLMICEMTGQYTLLPGLLITCVVSSVLSRTLRRDSIYRHHVAEHV
ncbi:chloride channel protein [Klebsiella pneumoniae]|uniref:chloride channel protein n=1 Tax=Klebsiella pneumoniae TaxID=573 RepID=UPI0020042AEA|nr:chloride channel protein [Klebsiella pneumoniae]MCK6044689.1 chloride channel protein [Klebsiella pneumoniae]